MTIKQYVIIIVSSLIFSSSLALAKNFNHQVMWRVDNTQKFQIGYLPRNSISKQNGKNVLMPKSLGLAPIYQPDITNINLANFLQLGFQIPHKHDAKNYKLYLKLFHFPKIFIAKNTTLPILKAFYLDKVNEANQLISYVENNQNVVVKKVFIAKTNYKFSQKNPFPRIKISLNQHNKQQAFNQQLPFYSLYVLPAEHIAQPLSRNALAQNREGLLSLGKNLLQVYQQHLQSIKGGKKDRYYFIAKKTKRNLIVISMLKKPLLFQNWKSLPMPTDRQHDFITGLWLVYQTTYTAASKQIKTNKRVHVINSSIFNKLYTEPKTKVLEIASVMYI